MSADKDEDKDEGDAESSFTRIEPFLRGLRPQEGDSMLSIFFIGSCLTGGGNLGEDDVEHDVRYKERQASWNDCPNTYSVTVPALEVVPELLEVGLQTDRGEGEGEEPLRAMRVKPRKTPWSIMMVLASLPRPGR